MNQFWEWKSSSMKTIYVVGAMLLGSAALIQNAYAADAPKNNPAPKPPLVSGPWALDEYMGEITMFIGETRVFRKPSVARLAVGNGRVLSAAVAEDDEILLIANGTGSSVLHLWTKDGRSARLKINVIETDVKSVARELMTYLSSMPHVKATVVGDKVLVEGTDLSDMEKSKLKTLMEHYKEIVNFTGSVGWEKMIYMDIKVVEFKKDKLRDVGIIWDKEIQGPSAGLAGDIHTNDYYTIGSKVGMAAGVTTRIPPFQNYLGIITELNSRLRLSENKGDAVILAQPRLAARSGSDAEFNVGGEIPYAYVTNQTSTVEWRKYGLNVKINPVMDNDRSIKSKITAEVSALDPSVTALNGLPALVSRKIQTEFNVRVGETLVLAGLLDRRKSRNSDEFPGLSQIPLLGDIFFRSHGAQDRETELVVFVTPMVRADESQEPNEANQKIEDDRKALVNRVDVELNPPPPPAVEPASSPMPCYETNWDEPCS